MLIYLASHPSSRHDPLFQNLHVPFIFQRAAMHFLKCFRNPKIKSNMKNSKHSSHGYFHRLRRSMIKDWTMVRLSGERGRDDKDLATSIEFEEPVALRPFQLLRLLFWCFARTSKLFLAGYRLSTYRCTETLMHSSIWVFDNKFLLCEVQWRRERAGVIVVPDGWRFI